MASVMLAAYPEIFAGVAIIAGLPYGAATSILGALALMKGQKFPSDGDLQSLLRSASPHKGTWPKISVWHGSVDHTVALANTSAIISQWRGVHDVSINPDQAEQIEGYPHRVWRDASGRDVIKEFIITGMEHGAPVQPGGQ